MTALEYLESKNVEYPLSSMDVLGCLDAIGVEELMESYHLAKSKEEAEERYEEAQGEALRMKFTKEMDFDLLLRIASGKEEE